MRTIRQSTGAAPGFVPRAFGFLLLALALWPAEAAAQQWESSGANIKNMNAGNVGIGTGAAAPTAKAQINTGGTTGVFVNGSGGQTADLLQLGKNDNPNYFRVDASGNITAIGGTNARIMSSAGRVYFPDNIMVASRMYGSAGVDYLQFSHTAGMFYYSNAVADGQQTAHTLSTLNALSAGNKLLSVKNGAAEKFAVDALGNVAVAGNFSATGNISARYQDVAEWVPSTQRLAAGTVVVLDAEKSNHVLASLKAYDTRVAGVVSRQPGVLLGEGGEGKLMVATTGRVKVRVDATRGAIKVGDLLVTGEGVGVAMRSEPLDFGGTPLHRPGTIIGKALEPLEKGTGEILVLLSLQ